MVAFVAVLWTAAVVSQAAPAAAAASALIAGRVVEAAGGRPVAGAIVSLAGAGLPTIPRAMTNANGYFVFRRLTSGVYSVTASRPGYVDGAPGRRRPGGMAAPLTIEDGQRITDVVIPIWRQATIGGTVTDDAGEPVIGAQVTGFQRKLVGGRSRIVRRVFATTDDRGIYRLTSLEPGDYLVAFVWRDTSIPLATAELLRRGINGGDPTVQQMVRERLTLQPGVGTPGSAATIQAGTSLRDLPPGSPPPPQSGGGVFIYPTEFYPGVPSAGRATAVTVGSGQDRIGIDLTLTPMKTVSVSGTLLGVDGVVANTALHLLPSGEGAGGLETSATMTDAQGGFTFLGVPPGQYTISVLRTPRSPGQPGTAGREPTLFAETPVTVGTRDVGGMVVTLQRGARVLGRLEFEGARDRPDAAAMTGVTVTLERADATVSMLAEVSTLPPAHADATAAFTTAGAPPGRYLVLVGAPPGWALKDVRTGGGDISETFLDLGATDVNDVVVTFTDRPTKVTGSATTRDGKPDADAVVVAFPVDQGAWSEYGANPRRLRSTHAARNGTYAMTGLPPGEYCLVAIHEDTIADWQDPRVLEGLARSGGKVRLGDGDARALDLTVIPGGAR